PAPTTSRGMVATRATKRKVQEGKRQIRKEHTATSGPTREAATLILPLPSSQPGVFSISTYVRQGWARRPGHGGSSGVTSTSGTTGKTSRDGATAECPIVLTTSPAGRNTSNFHSARLPPGDSTEMRIREPARNTCANGKISTRASTNSP